MNLMKIKELLLSQQMEFNDLWWIIMESYELFSDKTDFFLDNFLQTRSLCSAEQAGECTRQRRRGECGEPVRVKKSTTTS